MSPFPTRTTPGTGGAVRADGARLWIEALMRAGSPEGKAHCATSPTASESRRGVCRPLAGGVVHDFNNLLTIINGCSSLMLESEQLTEEGRERAAEMTQKLLMFSRQQVAHARSVDVNEVVAEAVGVYSRLIGEGSEVVSRLEARCGRVQCDPIHLNQILINLFTNAREVDAGFAHAHLLLATGPYVSIRVADTGMGMDAETLGKVVDPFFTTKEADKGKGRCCWRRMKRTCGGTRDGSWRGIAIACCMRML